MSISNTILSASAKESDSNVFLLPSLDASEREDELIQLLKEYQVKVIYDQKGFIRLEHEQNKLVKSRRRR